VSVLVTGASGFAGSHLVAACEAAGDTVLRLARSDGDLRADLTDATAAREAVASARPQTVYHLAAAAQVAQSWREPAETLHGNLAMTHNLLDAVRLEAPEAVVVLASSGEVYGPPAAIPVGEDAPLSPQNPYAVSKAACDLLGGFFADAHGVRVVRARAFNHAGPRQEPVYAIASFARQVAAGLEAGEDPVRVVTGNPDARRDYTDVRDVVRAYRELAARGESGVFNVCSGRSASAAELVAALGTACGVAVAHEVDPALVRAHEVMEVRGSFERLAAATGWAPEIALEQTLGDTVAWWREELRAGRATAVIHE
jgi:GDP-4-dehydro-6-deoxy-D-mannose reductase